MNVVGIDPSLTATAIAAGSGPRVIKTNLRGCERMVFIRDLVLTACADLPDPFVLIEGFSFGSNNRSAREIGGLGWVIRVALHEHGISWREVPPTTLKKYATGRGNAGKVEMVTSARERLGYRGHDDNEADAMWLHAVGCALLGEPVVELPKTHRDALMTLESP